MEGVAALGHVDNILAVEGVIGDHVVEPLAHAQTLGVVNKAGGGAGLAHLLELVAVLPGVGPGAVAGGIANGVVGDRHAVVGGELVLPVGFAIGVVNCLESGALGAGGVGVIVFVQNVAALVVGVNTPEYLIICTNELWNWCIWR